MGWLDTSEHNRRQHLQMFATGNIRDIDRIHERNRRRSINAIFWFLFIVSGVLAFFYIRDYQNGYWLAGLSLLFLIILIFRYGLHKQIKNIKRNKHKGKRKDWEKLNHLPNWAYRKMKRKRKNIVNGEHYIYKKEGNRFYRKKK